MGDRICEQHQRYRHRHRAAQVEAARATRVPTLGQQAPAQREHDDRDRDVDEEHAFPAERGGDRAADHQAGGRADPADPAPDAERPVALGAFREDRHQEGEGSWVPSWPS